MSMLKDVTIEVPSSSANVGPGYDIWCVGTRRPYLRVTCTRTESEVGVECKSPYQPPEGRELGYKGRLAAEGFLRDFKINGGVHLLYDDSNDGFPVGGLGRSGAEIIGALLSSAIIYGKLLNRRQFITMANDIEGHPDNVAASTNGRFNIIAKSPYDNGLHVDCYDMPEDLGLAIGFSSHKKTGGTEAGRNLEPLSVGDFVAQTGYVSVLTAALVSGNIDRFLEFVGADMFHEPRRADIGFYGNFNNKDLTELKRELLRFGVGWCVSGAGPNMQAWYGRKRYPNGIVEKISPVVVPWFADRGIGIEMREMEIAKEGTYDYAKRHYDYGFNQSGF